MDEIKRIFESENIRFGFDESVDDRGRILVASKDRGFRKYDRWVINHLSVDEACELRDRLDELLMGMDKNMRCPKCGKNVYSHHQEIDWTKTTIMRRYGCRNCHHKFRTIERIIEESEK